MLNLLSELLLLLLLWVLGLVYLYPIIQLSARVFMIDSKKMWKIQKRFERIIKGTKLLFEVIKALIIEKKIKFSKFNLIDILP